jgi:hypothetical protein
MTQGEGEGSHVRLDEEAAKARGGLAWRSLGRL